MSRGSLRKGFSLVELSIVLVILGLLTGGILAGQSLIRAAELRSVPTEYQRIMAATQTFRDKYMALPGDMTNATAFWGKADPTPATCRDTPSAGLPTCDGNGNGSILYTTGSNEIFRFWQHLANAGLIEGTYTGVQYNTENNSSHGGVNSPSGRLSNSTWHTQYTNGFSGHTWWLDGTAADYGNILVFGSNNTNGTPSTILTPGELWNIDTKLDDGKPHSGKLWAMKWATCTDAATSADPSPSYKLTSNSTSDCGLAFRQAF